MRTVSLLCFAAALAALAALSGCGSAQQDVQSDARAPIQDISNVDENLDEGEVRFSDILTQYQALNARLDNVAARLQIANAELCPVTTRGPGFNVHTISDYPAQLQSVARSFLGVDEDLSVRTVRSGGPAQAAGLQVGDRVVSLNGQGFDSSLSPKIAYARAAEAAFEKGTARLNISRAGEDVALEIAPQTLCGYPAIVVFDERVNGHTNGHEVLITSGLMRSTKADVNLALIVAHEMSHAIEGHIALDPNEEARKALELRADSMALVMLARAGFEIKDAVAYWTRADNPQRQSQSRSETHPSLTARLDNFEHIKRVVTDARRRGEPLDFSLID